MKKHKEPVNPFYVLLVVLGTAFAITATAYGVMAFKAVRAAPAPSAAGQGLLTFLNAYGMWLMAAELAGLAIATFGAMGIDQYRMSGKNSAKNAPSRDSSPDSKLRNAS